MFASDQESICSSLPYVPSPLLPSLSLYQGGSICGIKKRIRLSVIRICQTSLKNLNFLVRITREKDCFLIPYLILFNVVRSFEEEIMMSLTEVAKKCCVFFAYKSLCGSVAKLEPVESQLFEIWSRTRNIFLINIYCNQFGGCQDEDELISTSTCMELLLLNSFKWQYMHGWSRSRRQK